MRRTARLAAFLVFAVALITCSDAPTGPGAPGSGRGVAARFALSPVFSPAAVQAASALQEVGVTIASVRVAITRPGTNESLFDRIVAVKPGQASVSLEVEVQIRSGQEQLLAVIDFREANGVVLYAATQLLTVHRGDNPPGSVPIAEVQFVGPGALATQLHVTPAEAAISTALPLQLVAKAVDASGGVVAGPLLAWSTSDAALATVNATGLVTPTGARGTVKIGARIPTGLAASATLRLVPPPVRIVVIGGGGQSGTVGSLLPQPFTVEVTAADGLPAQGEKVTFSAVTPGGAVALLTAVTDAQGRASTPVTLGTAVGTYEFRAISGSLAAVSISANALAGTAARILMQSGDGQSAEVRSVLSPLAVRLTDAFGNAVAGAVVNWAPDTGGGTLSAPSSTSGADGIARVTYTLGTLAGTATVTASLAADASVTVKFTLTAIAAPASAIAVFSGDAQSAIAGDTLAKPLVARVTDRYGVAVAGVAVTWSVAGAATPGATTSYTGGDGNAQTTLTLGTLALLPATVTVYATITAGATATFTATILPLPALTKLGVIE